MTFSDLGLRPELLDAVARQGYETPSPIQAALIPVLLPGGDAVATAARADAGGPILEAKGVLMQFGGLKADDAKRLKDLERENSTLKRLLADAELEKAALKEIARGNF